MIIPIFAVVSAYTLIVSVLLQYGYISHYGIPTDYISVISGDSVILSYTILRGIGQMILGVKPFTWITIILIFLFLLFLYKILELKKTVYVILCLPFIMFAFNAEKTGDTLAKITTTFKIASTKCSSKGLDNYISPLTYNGEVIFVRTENNKMIKGAVLSRKLSDLPCGVEEKTITLSQ